MKTLRYLLSLVAILSVVSVSAATFGTTHQSQKRGIQYTSSYSQMPTLSMSTMNASMMKSGSALPMAAVSGTTTADDNAPNRHRAKRAVDEDDIEVPKPDDNEIPDPTPIGDAAVPMMLMALAWVMVRMIRRKAAQ